MKYLTAVPAGSEERVFQWFVLILFGACSVVVISPIDFIGFPMEWLMVLFHLDFSASI